MKIAANKNEVMTPVKLKQWLVSSFFCAVMLLVLLNIFTPLRLNVDGIRYLNILQYLKGGLATNSQAAHDFFPHGYPWLLFLLDRLGLLSPVSITFINILSVFVSCQLLTKILPVKNKLLFWGLVILSFVNIKHYSLPLADQLFVMLFMAGIYLWSEFFQDKRRYILPCLLVTAISIYVRTAGIALVPAIVFQIIYRNRHQLARRKFLIYGTGIIIIAAILFLIQNVLLFEKKVEYIRQLNLMLIIREPYTIIERLLMHLKEIGEVILNVPYSKLNNLVRIGNFDMANYILIITGIISIYIFIKAIIHLKLYTKYIFWTLVSYFLMIFLWPFYDTRFMMPVIPILIYLAFTYVSVMVKNKKIRVASFIVYSGLGAAALLYSDALSLNKNFFLNHYGFDDKLTSDYRIHFNDQIMGTANKKNYNIENDNVLFLLSKYDR